MTGRLYAEETVVLSETCGGEATEREYLKRVIAQPGDIARCILLAHNSGTPSQVDIHSSESRLKDPFPRIICP